MKLNEIENAELSELAVFDLDEIWLFISRDSAYYADKTIDDLIERISMLGLNPKAGTAKGELLLGLRLFPYNDYNIFYFPTDTGVEISRVLHSSRDSVQIFNKSIDAPDYNL